VAELVFSQVSELEMEKQLPKKIRADNRTPRPRVEFVAMELVQNATQGHFLECSNVVEIFDGDEYLIQSQNFPMVSDVMQRFIFTFTKINSKKKVS
jgi:hypothetical protein